MLQEKKNKLKKSTQHHHMQLSWTSWGWNMSPTLNQKHVSSPRRKGNNQEQDLSRHFAPVTKFTRTQLSDKFSQVLSKKRVLQQVNSLAKSKRETRGREGDADAFQAGLPHPLKEWQGFIDQTGLDLNLEGGFVNISWQQKVSFNKCLALFHLLSFHYLGTTPSPFPSLPNIRKSPTSSTYSRTGRRSHAAIHLQA